MPRQARLEISSIACGLRELAVGVEPEAGADLAHADQGDGEQARCLGREAGVVGDHLGDRVGALAGDPVDPLADGRLAGQVGLEHEPERAAGVGDVLVERLGGRGDPLLVDVGRGERRRGRRR